MKRLLLLGSTLLILGCGDDGRAPPADPGDGNSGRGGGSGTGGMAGGDGGTSGDGGRAGGTGGSAPGDLRVRVIEPPELLDPADGDVLTNLTIPARCEALPADQPNAAPIDDSTVRMQILVGREVFDDEPGVPAGLNEYTASLSVEAAKSDDLHGPIAIRCTADDEADPVEHGSGEIQTFFDRGPNIEIVSPLDKSSFALIGAVPFEFRVSPAPLVDDDPGAEVSEVSLEVAGQNVEVTEKSGTYTAAIDFLDATQFPQPPSGQTPIIIRATNARETERVFGYSFNLDGTGPDIDIVSPAIDDMVGGNVGIRFRVVDDLSMVDPASIAVVVNTVRYVYDANDRGRWTPETNGDYVFHYDTREDKTSFFQLTVNIQASDSVGNASIQSRTFYVDNSAPSIWMDPPNIREVSDDGQCSFAFDPLGLAVGDTEIIGIFPRFRALVWEEANTLRDEQDPTRDEYGYISFLDPESVVLHFQPDPDVGVMEDMDGDPDGICDAIIPDANKTVNKLTALENDGTSLHGPESNSPCPPFTSANDPDPLCDGRSDLYRIIDHEVVSREDVIYVSGSPPVPECTGARWDIGAVTDREGWVCLAVEATDRVGNHAISAPLRACLDRPGGITPSCASNYVEEATFPRRRFSRETPPSCTRTCVAPTPDTRDILRIPNEE